MKRFIPLLFFSFFVGFSQTIIWQENFGVGCNQGQLANGAAPTASNGAWSVTMLNAPIANDPQSNEWFISATEAGMGANNCGDGCLSNPPLTNRSLHVGSNLPPLLVDPGAAYLALPGFANTNKRVESPNINTTGQSNLTLEFEYMLEGIPNTDFCELVYSTNGGATWNTLSLMAQTNNTCVGGQGLWTAFSIPLPAAANNIPNLKIGFRWQNSDPVGADPSFAVDNIVIKTASLTFTIPTTVCVNQTVQATVTGTVAGATSYTWASFPSGAVFSPVTGTQVNVSFPSSGTYTIVCVALNNVPSVIGSSSVVVTVNPVPTVAIAPASQTICSGQSATLTASGASTYTWSNASNASSIVVSPAVTSTYAVSGSSNGCASGTVTATVSVFGATASASSSSVCPGSPVNLSVTPGTSYTWSSPSNPNLANTQTVTDSPTSATIYTVTVNNGACSVTSTVQVGMSTGLTLTVSANPSNICPGQSATLTASGATSYTWSTSATTNSIVVSPTTTTSYTVTGAAGSCTGQAILLVSVSNTIVFAVNPSTINVCPGGTLTLNAPAGGTYTWSIPSSTNQPTGATMTLTPPVAGVYTVTGTNSFGCPGVGTATVTTNNQPLTLSASANPTGICIGQTSQLNATGASNYTWTPASSLNNSLIANPVANPTVTTAYVVVGEQGGCTGTANVIVNITQGPPMNISVSHTAVCAGYNATLSGSGANIFNWWGGNISGTITNQPSVSVGPGTYTVEGTSPGFQCSSMSVITIGTLAPLNILVTQSDYTTCIATNNPKYSKPVTLIAGGATWYSWTPCDQYITPCVGPTVVVRPQTSTQYTVVGFTSVCSGTAIITVTVVPQVTINVVPPSPITCNGSCFNFTVINTNSTVPPPFTYSWTEPNSAPASLNNPLSQTVIACPTIAINTPSAEITYTVEMFDGRGCVSIPRLVHTTVLAQPTVAAFIPTINGVPVNTVCFTGDITGIPNTITLTAKNVNSGPPNTLPPGVVPTFTWCAISTSTQPCGNDLSLVGPINDYSVLIIPNSKLPSTKTYTVRSGYNGIDGCYAEDTVTIRIVDCRYVTQVTFSITNNEDTLCTGQCITFTNTTDAGDPQTCNWIFPGGNPVTSTLQAPTVCYNLPGKYNVILTVGNPYGPSVTKGINQMVKVFDYPNTTIVPPGQLASDTVIRFGMQIALTATGATHYNWYPNQYMNCLTCPFQTIAPLQSQQFVVEGYFVPQCVSRDTINVIVLDDCGEIFIPNAFSPNGKDHYENETFKVYGYCLKTMLLQVFNRWGQKVFETTKQNEGWDGTFDGEPLNSGVYVYRLEGVTYDNKKVSLKGNVTLIR